MTNNLIKDPIDGYIKEISDLLPYPPKQKTPVLEELRKDVIDAMGSEKRPPSVVFGSPKEVAKNISFAQDWGYTNASWLMRISAFVIDLLLTMGVFGIFAIIRILMSDADVTNWYFWHKEITFGFLFIVIPVTAFLLSYFMILEKSYSTTIGKRILGLIVVDESGIRITWTQSFIRNFTKVPGLTTFLPFDFLLGLFSEKTQGRNQRVLDFVAGTNVIKKS
jgi:uncharacterized RDD family membrane protein YckC